MATEFKYWAFISYSHQDNRKGGNLWGDWLHEAVENFKVPPELVGRHGHANESVPARMYPSFQDEKELPTNANLGMAINEALEKSRYLVVICSPRSAKSIYVNQEVLEFKRLGRANRILAIIIDGEPNASEPGKGFDPAWECFPEALRHPLGADGNLNLTQHAEPIAADVRGLDGKEASLKDKIHQLVLEREKLRVMAGLLGVGFDDLVQRDKERQLKEERARSRRLQKLVAGFSILTLLALMAGTIAKFEQKQAEQEKMEAEQNLLDARHRLAQIYVDRANAAYGARDIAQQVIFLSQAQILDPSSVACSVVEDLTNRTTKALWDLHLKTPLNALALSPDERIAYVGGDDGRVIELETTTGQIVCQNDTRGTAVLGITISRDGKYAATANADGIVRLWSIKTWQLVKELKGHTRLVTSVWFSPDGQTLYSTSDDRTIIAWDLADGQIRYRIEAHSQGVNSVTTSPDGKILVSASDDKTIKLWLARDGSSIATLTGNNEDVAIALFTPDGTRLLAAGGDGMVRVWQPTSSPRLLYSIHAHDASIGTLAISADGQTIFSGGADKTIRVWNLDHSEERFQISGHTGWITGIRPILNGAYLLSCAQDGRVCLWSIPQESDVCDLIGHQYIVRRAAFAPDGGTAVTAGDDLTIRQWSIPDGKPLSVWKGHTGPITALTYFQNGQDLLTASHDETARIWDVATGNETSKLIGHTSLIWCAAVSTNDLWALSGGADQDLRLWNLQTKQLERLFKGQDSTVNSVAFSPDGHFALSGGNDRTAILWKVPSGEILRRFTGNLGQVSSVAFASNGEQVLTAAWNDDIRLWDLKTPTNSPMILDDGDLGCDAAIYSPDGRLILGGGLDGTLRVWSVRTGIELRQIPAHIGRIYGLAVSSNGRYVLTCGLNGRVRLWKLNLFALDATPPEPGPAERQQLIDQVEDQTGLSLIDGKVVLSASSQISHSSLMSQPQLQNLSQQP
ncbi:MAG TPA: PQQ-binding-like beta-propeller repeat protein [Verrucomicrobiae bacterium]|jgi:WD40 repeat protein